MLIGGIIWEMKIDVGFVRGKKVEKYDERGLFGNDRKGCENRVYIIF